MDAAMQSFPADSSLSCGIWCRLQVTCAELRITDSVYLSPLRCRLKGYLSSAAAYQLQCQFPRIPTPELRSQAATIVMRGVLFSPS